MSPQDRQRVLPLARELYDEHRSAGMLHRRVQRVPYERLSTTVKQRWESLATALLVGRVQLRPEQVHP